MRIVGHSVNPFLFGTGSWVYTQIKGLERWRAVDEGAATPGEGVDPGAELEIDAAAAERLRALGYGD